MIEIDKGWSKYVRFNSTQRVPWHSERICSKQGCKRIGSLWGHSSIFKAEIASIVDKIEITEGELFFGQEVYEGQKRPINHPSLLSISGRASVMMDIFILCQERW
jgi:hypothetical protein